MTTRSKLLGALLTLVMLFVIVGIGLVLMLKKDTNPKPSTTIIPTYRDVKYGPHDENLLDFYQAKQPGPRPVVFYVHGGAWTHFNRHDIHTLLHVDTLLEKGISVVTFDYRSLYVGERLGMAAPVKLPLDDSARALQFVRSKSKEWNIDPDRFAGCGGSAGGCSILWLALHDDMATEEGDAIARESTRLQHAITLSPQTTLDPVVTREWIPNIAYGQNAFGFRSMFEGASTEFKRFYSASTTQRYSQLVQEYSPLTHLSKDDPPVVLYYVAKEMPQKGDVQEDPTHSALFGAMYLDASKKLGRTKDSVHLLSDSDEPKEVLTKALITTLAAP